MGVTIMSVAEVSGAGTDAFDDLRGRIEQLPSERDWALYQAVRVEQWPTRAAATGFGISQTRVCQIVQRTAAFVAQAVTVPSKEEEAQQLAAGKQLAADRIDYLYGQAMSCFRYSQGKDNSCSTGRRSYGDMRYLQTAARLALIASTLPQPRPAWPGTLEDEPASEPKQERDSAPSSQAAETCSAAPVEQPAELVAEAIATTATAAAIMSCVVQSRGEAPAQSTAARPVQKGSGNKAKAASRREEFFQTG
jgi:hypothetical protein